MNPWDLIGWMIIGASIGYALATITPYFIDWTCSLWEIIRDNFLGCVNKIKSKGRSDV